MKQSGYVVLDNRGSPLCLCQYGDDEPFVLASGDTATLFTTRSRALAALRRTVRYKSANNLTWDLRCSVRKFTAHDRLVIGFGFSHDLIVAVPEKGAP